jgi:hypothetical protein
MRHTLLLACVVLAILLSSISLALQIRKQQDEGFNLVKYAGANATELEVLLARVDLMALREIVPCTDGVCPPAYHHFSPEKTKIVFRSTVLSSLPTDIGKRRGALYAAIVAASTGMLQTFDGINADNVDQHFRIEFVDLSELAKTHDPDKSIIAVYDKGQLSLQ